MDTEKCNEWSEERLKTTPKNPLTNRKIKINGPKYKELDEDCKDFIVDINSICVKWLQNNHPNLYLKIKKSSSPQKSSKKDPQKSPKKDPQKSPKKDPQKSPKKNPQKSPKKDPQKSPKKNPQKSPKKNPQNFYSVEDRKRLGIDIKNYFSSVIIEDGKACMTENSTLLKYVDEKKLLGLGSFGNVYGVTIPKTDLSVAIKEGAISTIELKKALKKQYPLEYLYNKLINDLIDEKICPNFSYTYAIFFCDKCLLNRSKLTQCSETVVELFHFTLDKLKDLKDEAVLSILFQILFALASIQLEYGMFHNDVKKENILIKVIPKGGYWEYNLNNDMFRVPNHGYIAALNDFGVSLTFRQGISNKDYGRRQTEVVKDYKTNTYYFKPFTTKFYPEPTETGSVLRVPSHNLSGSKGLTWNHFYRDFDSEPSIPVNLKDMGRFPVEFFNYDIVDTVRMFVGGKRTSQSGTHYPMNVSNNIIKLFDGFYKIKPNTEWPPNRVDLFLADHTIRKLFPFYLNAKQNGPKIEEYYLNLLPN
jgi:hypothetical protein